MDAREVIDILTDEEVEKYGDDIIQALERGLTAYFSAALNDYFLYGNSGDVGVQIIRDMNTRKLKKIKLHKKGELVFEKIV